MLTHLRCLRPLPLTLLPFLWLSACGGEPGAWADPIVIGVLIPGENSGLEGNDLPLQRGANLAAREINAAGGLLGGRRVVLEVQQTLAKPDVGKAAAQRLVEEEGAVGILGAAASGVSLAVHEYTSMAMIPQISCCSTSRELTGLSDRFFFRTVPPDPIQAKLMARLAKDEACTNVGIVHINNAYGDPFAMDIASSLQTEVTGITLVGTESYAPDGSTLAAAATTLAEATPTPDCILMVSFEEGGEFVREWKDRALPAVKFIGADGMRTPSTPARSGAALFDGVLGVAPITAPLSSEFDTFSSNHIATYGERPAQFSNNQYDGLMLMALAIQQANSTNGTDIREALPSVTTGNGMRVEPGGMSEALRLLDSGSRVNYRGASGEVNFDADGNVISAYEYWRYDATVGDFVETKRIPESQI